MENYKKYLKEERGKLWYTEVEHDSLEIDYEVKEILFSQTSPFQHVMMIDTVPFGKMLILDGIVQTTALDGHIYNEAISHVPLNLHPCPKRVLIIGGGDCGVAREVAKYPEVEKADMVEIDELVVKVCKEHLPEVSGNLSDPRVNFRFEDGLAFAKNPGDKYDIVIVDSSDPVGPAVKLFELDFYRDLYNLLADDGILVCQSESPIFYADIMKQTYRRIGSLFPLVKLYMAVVPTYPGGFWTFTLGSKNKDIAFKDRFDKNTKYINEETLRSCFALPRFVRDILESEDC